MRFATLQSFTATAMVVGLALQVGCGAKSEFPMQAGKYEIVGIFTDDKDTARAKLQAEGCLDKYDDIKCMVGLWSYNPPQILSAVKNAEKLGKVKIVGFDEDKVTLAGIKDGHIHGTIVQKPYSFGYKSIEYLAALARGQTVDVPDDKMMYIDHESIKKDTAAAYNEKMNRIRKGDGDSEKDDVEYDTSKRVMIAFITNSVDQFWDLAKLGCAKAGEDLNVEVVFEEPTGATVQEQNTILEQMMIDDTVDGIAISPIAPENQKSKINEAAAKKHLICHDSDAPTSERLFYLGTSNIRAGYAAGKLVKEVCPDGGRVAVFVGKREVLNARERFEGLVKALKGESVD